MPSDSAAAAEIDAEAAVFFLDFENLDLPHAIAVDLKPWLFAHTVDVGEAPIARGDDSK